MAGNRATAEQIGADPEQIAEPRIVELEQVVVESRIPFVRENERPSERFEFGRCAVVVGDQSERLGGVLCDVARVATVQRTEVAAAGERLVLHRVEQRVVGDVHPGPGVLVDVADRIEQHLADGVEPQFVSPGVEILLEDPVVDVLGGIPAHAVGTAIREQLEIVVGEVLNVLGRPVEGG